MTLGKSPDPGLTWLPVAQDSRGWIRVSRRERADRQAGTWSRVRHDKSIEKAINIKFLFKLLLLLLLLLSMVSTRTESSKWRSSTSHTRSLAGHPLKRTSIHLAGRFLTIFLLLPGGEDPVWPWIESHTVSKWRSICYEFVGLLERSRGSIPHMGNKLNPA